MASLLDGTKMCDAHALGATMLNPLRAVF